MFSIVSVCHSVCQTSTKRSSCFTEFDFDHSNGIMMCKLNVTRKHSSRICTTRYSGSGGIGVDVCSHGVWSQRGCLALEGLIPWGVWPGEEETPP